MRTIHSSTTEGVSTGEVNRDLPDRDPLDRDLPGQRPPHKDPPGQRPPTWRNMGPGTDTPRRNMGPGCQTGSDIIRRPPPPPDRMTDTRPENITLPQTSFAGGNNICDHEADLSALIKIFGLISFIFMQFSANILSNIRFLPQTHGLTLPRLGNPGSVT